MSTPAARQSEANKDLVRRHIDLSWNDADFDGLDDVWAPDAIVHLYDGLIAEEWIALGAPDSSVTT